MTDESGRSLDLGLVVLRLLASVMLDGDYTYDTPDRLRQILNLDEAVSRLIQDTCERYRILRGGESVRPDEIVDKLLVHAMLDRLPNKNLIGFANDFILGTLQGDVVEYRGDWIGSDSQIDRISTAFVAQSSQRRASLWTQLETIREAGDDRTRLNLDLRLVGSPQGHYIGSQFSDLEFRNTTFGEPTLFRQCTFIRCTFHRCRFHGSRLADCSFVECSFFNCKADEQIRPNLQFFDCTFVPNVFRERLRGITVVLPEPEQPGVEADLAASYRRLVLEQFWPPGRPHMTGVKRKATLFRGRAPSEHALLAVAIEQLIRDGIIYQLPEDRTALKVAPSMIHEVFQILGRVPEKLP